jgi:APA family basic amino acid/polyamine antiporter
LLFAMADDGHLPRVIGAVHPRFRTPHVAIVLSSIVMFALTLSGSFVALASISVVIRLLTYVATCAALLRLRRQADAAPAQFVAPFGQVAAVGALALSVWLLSNSTRSDAWTTVMAGAVGLAFYFIFRVRRRRGSR